MIPSSLQQRESRITLGSKRVDIARLVGWHLADVEIGSERILKCQPDLKSRLFPVTVTDRVNRNGFLGIVSRKDFRSDERLII